MTHPNYAKGSQQIIIEILWLILSLGLTILLALFLFGKTFLAGTIDIHLQDTFFVISTAHLLFPIFFLVTFFVYFIKEYRKSFRRILSNWILILSGLTLIIALTFLIKTFSQFFTGGWALYPPLSALGPGKVSELTRAPVTNVITNFFTVVQIIILTMLLYATFRSGSQKTTMKNEN